MKCRAPWQGSLAAFYTCIWPAFYVQYISPAPTPRYDPWIITKHNDVILHMSS